MDRRFLPLVFVLATLAMSVVASASFAQATQAQVSAVDNEFLPRTITINAGDTVVWTNNGQLPHTVTADDGSFDSGLFFSGQTFSLTFDTPGTFPYHCTLHGAPGGVGMAGVVVVQAVSAEAQPTLAPAATEAPAPTEVPTEAQVEVPTPEPTPTGVPTEAQIEVPTPQVVPAPAVTPSPAALPSAGEGDSFGQWLMVLAAGLLLVGGGLAALRVASRER